MDTSNIEIHKGKSYFHLTSQIPEHDNLIVREVNSELSDDNASSRTFEVIYAYNKHSKAQTIHITQAQLDSGVYTLKSNPPTINHLPSDYGLWFEYQPHRFRYKMMYDVMLNDGSIIQSCYPNGITFSCFNHKQELSVMAKSFLERNHGEIKDSCVKAIRLRPIPTKDEEDEELMSNSSYNLISNFDIFKNWIVGVN